MRYSGLEDLVKRGKAALAAGPVAMVFAEDETELDTTLRHHMHLGFRSVVVFVWALWDCPPDLRDKVHRVDYDMSRDGAVQEAVTAVAAAAPWLWMFYCYNAEYLFYPFCESRTVGEMLAFHSEERRDAMLTYVVDLYAGDLDRFPEAVSLDDAHIDKAGYYALAATIRTTTIIPRNGNSIFSVACAGATRSMSPKSGARSTGSPFSVPNRG